jgi:nucleoside-diphosphate-sugar epimerase
MIFNDLTDRLLSVYDQIVIYGAKGWIGRSAVHVISDKKTHWNEKQILLVGSRSEFLTNSDKSLKVYSANEAEKYVSKNCIFLNAAGLRREKLKSHSQNEFINKSREIIEFGEKLLKQKRIKTFINLSSGAASQKSDLNENGNDDVYTKCKIHDELIIKNASETVSAALINCRVYSISGRFLNEFENLAVSLFIKQAIAKPHIIKVKSQNTRRTYLDSIDLVKVLFELSLSESSYTIDSGGFLIKLGELADKIATIIPGSSVHKVETTNKSPDYYGDFETFNELADKFGIKLLNIERQIIETLNAFQH